MNIFFEFSIYLLLSFFLNFFFIKKKLMLDLPSIEQHKQKIFFADKVPKSLGIIIFLFFLFNFQLEIFEKFFLSLVFFLGVLSDTKKLNSPKLRFFLQIFVVIVYLFYSGDTVKFTNIFYIDYLLQFKYFAIFLTSISILIIINGSNFIDGLNTLCLGYYLSISLILLLFDLNEIYQLDFIYFFILILTLLFIFNLFGKSFLGDSGSYFLGFLFSVILIDIHLINDKISPWFFAVLLWYPAFEILFTIIRRSILLKNPFFPDNRHFHQLLYLYFKKKFTLKISYLNPLIGNIINIYNLLVFYFAYTYYDLTLNLITIFIFNCIIYLIIYLILNNDISK
jgi:UDP-N-acetylmuramyl pentapeptide phosphotransferase/UDP-N-acetylglucosamine-1-phosphate transferase